ncbi:MAG TPA: sugar ABC transporter substrate-binding protein, partial [Lachnoclostridium sp.]|nr:sugar ABC transporter substrate-binding protein [Lachnoclostridium sp.]
MKKKMMMLVMGTCLVLSGCSSTAGKSEPVNAQIEKTTESSGNVENNTEGGDSSKEMVAGVCWYNFADTFISNTRQTLLNVSEADQTIKVMDADSQNDTSNQTNNMNNFLTKDVDYLVLNNINTGAISEICDQLKEAGCYAIFANTDSPKDEDFEKNDKLYLVSSNAPKSGSIMGEALVEYWKTHPEADRNGNGKMDC